MIKIDRFKIRKLREERNITQAELACDTDTGQTVINTIESGKNSNPKIKTIFKIAEYFGVKVEELFEETT